MKVFAPQRGADPNPAITCPSPFHDAGDWGPALLEALRKYGVHKPWCNKIRGEDCRCGLDIIIAAVEGKEDGDAEKQ